MPIRVLVVDDSAFMRRIVGEAISSQPDMELAGVAHNGLSALLKVEQLQPDVVTLDVEMPEMDGLTALRHLMSRYPRPVVMLIIDCYFCGPAFLLALLGGWTAQRVGLTLVVRKEASAASRDADS